MTYGPGDRLPDLHLDPPDTPNPCEPECEPLSIDQCEACNGWPAFDCEACGCENVRTCTCPPCDICGDWPEQCAGHPEVEALIESVTP